jgi:RHS repeat-associated protein
MGITENGNETPLSISYDPKYIGNPTQIGNKSLVWEGRRLKEISSDNIHYIYNEQGFRTSKDVDGVPTKYYLRDKDIIAEETGGVKTIFIYNDENQLIGFEYEGNYYFYEKDLLGNITNIIDTNGTIMVTYQYDAWGNWINKASASNGTDLGNTLLLVNPFIYKGYYYDKETDWYYLKSRYYCPRLSRFIGEIYSSKLTFHKSRITVSKSKNSELSNGLSLSKYNLISQGIQFQRSKISGLSISDNNLGEDRFPYKLLDYTLNIVDFSVSISGSIRAFLAIQKNPGLENLMKHDGVSELPGALSKTLKWVGFGLIGIDVAYNAYNKYQNGESLNRIIDNSLVRASLSVGVMYSAGIAGAKVGMVVGNLIPIPGAGMVIGSIVGFGVGYGLSRLTTEVDVFGDTVEGHLTDFIDTITFWN